MIPASTRRLRAMEHGLQVAVWAHRQSLDAIGVFWRHRDRSPAVAEGRAIARLLHLRSRAAVVAVRERKHLTLLPALGLQHILRAFQLECTLGRRELGEGAMRRRV